MIVLIIVAFLIGFLLIFLLRGSTPHVRYESMQPGSVFKLGTRPKELANQNPGEQAADPWSKVLETLSLADLEDFCRKLATQLGLTFLSIDQDSPQEFHLLARLEKTLLSGDVILCGFYCPPNTCVGSDTIINFSDMVKAEKAMKGIFVTNGAFSEEVMKLNEGANMELIDGHAMKAVLPSWSNTAGGSRDKSEA